MSYCQSLHGKGKGEATCPCGQQETKHQSKTIYEKRLKVSSSLAATIQQYRQELGCAGRVLPCTVPPLIHFLAADAAVQQRRLLPDISKLQVAVQVRDCAKACHSRSGHSHISTCQQSLELAPARCNARASPANLKSVAQNSQL